jgi:hypothetical protein
MPPGSSRSGIAASPTTGEKAREIAMGRNQLTRSIHRPARPPRLWQASSATEPVASVHHRDCRDRQLRSRRTSPALTCRDRLRAVGPSVTGWRRLQLGELCGNVWRGAASPPRQATVSADLQALFETGATGLEPATSALTGRVRHRDAWRRTPPKRPYLQGFSAPGSARCRMVEPIVQSTSGPRSCHGRQRRAPGQNRLTTSRGGAVVCLCGSYRTCMSTGVGHVAG